MMALTAGVDTLVHEMGAGGGASTATFPSAVETVRSIADAEVAGTPETECALLEDGSTTELPLACGLGSAAAEDPDG